MEAVKNDMREKRTMLRIDCYQPGGREGEAAPDRGKGRGGGRKEERGSCIYYPLSAGEQLYLHPSQIMF